MLFASGLFASGLFSSSLFAGGSGEDVTPVIIARARARIRTKVARSRTGG
jgi:hypothetical protein